MAIKNKGKEKISLKGKTLNGKLIFWMSVLTAEKE